MGSPFWGADAADIAVFYGHGAAVVDAFINAGSYAWVGKPWSDGFCAGVWGEGSHNRSEWGDTNLVVIVMEICQSVQLEVLGQSSCWMMRNNASLFLGYHGISYDSSEHASDFEDWVDHSQRNGLGDSSVGFNSEVPGGGNGDTCAAALSCGATSLQKEDVYLNSGFKDFKTIGSIPKFLMLVFTRSRRSRTKKGMREPTVTAAAAKKVFVEMRIQGVRVQGPKVILGYYPDGALQKAFVRWPAASGAAHLSRPVLGRDEVVQRVHSALVEHPLGLSSKYPRTDQ